MEGFFLSNACCGTSTNSSSFRLWVPSFSDLRNYRSNISLLPRKPRKKVFVYAASNKDEPELDEWEQMELKFGRLIGEDPKLTLAKVMGRKSNPDLSFLDIEKLYNKRGKAGFIEIEELPYELPDRRKPTDSKGKSGISEIKEVPRNVSDVRKPSNPTSGLKLVRPVLKKGVKFEANEKPSPRAPTVKRSSQQVARTEDNSTRSDPGITLRKPSSFYEDDVKPKKLLGLSEEWDLAIKIGEKQSKERLSDTKLVRKPDPYVLKNEEEASQEAEAIISTAIEEYLGNKSRTTTNVSLLQKPEIVNLNLSGNQKPDESTKSIKDGNSMEGGVLSGVSLSEKPEIANFDLNGDQKQEDSVNAIDENNSLESGTLTDVSLLQKPKIVNPTFSGDQKQKDSGGQIKRLDRPSKIMLTESGYDTSRMNPESFGDTGQYENSSTKPPIKEHEDIDWARAEDWIKGEVRDDVEVIGVSTRGFAVSFGSLIGFLPYRNFATRWRYFAFESWLRKKGLDPSIYKKNLGIVGKYEAATSVKTSLDSSVDSKVDSKVKMEWEVSSDMKLEDLLAIYEQEKLKYLSSFVGQKVKVYVVVADRQSRKLIFSAKQREKEESIEKRKRLMAKLSVGDVVKCRITKIAYFGIFVEVEGVPALIHQTEASWDATLDPSSCFKSGQVIEAKVHQLDFSLGRILLSLKQITPDPLIETLESVLRDQPSLDGRLEAAQADTEWSDVELLIKELQQYEGIHFVSKGRYFLTPGLAPTFQVYMASTLEDQYTLVARYGKKVQELKVITSLSKEEMKSAILACTNRVK